MQRLGKLKTLKLSVYIEADFAGEASTLKSTTSYVLLLGSGIVQWHLKGQSITASSRADAEFIASPSAIQKLVWLHQLVQEIIYSSLRVSMLFNNNQVSLSTFKDTAYKSHCKYISVRGHQIREFIEDGKDVIIDYYYMDKMSADSVTKLLVAGKHVKCVRMYGLL